MDEFKDEIGKKEKRKLRSLKKGEQSVWFGLGMFGLIGWAVAIPTLIGIAVGVWMDTRWPGRISWTLTMLIVGVAVGCMNAWYWVSKERQEIEREGKGEDSNG